MDIANGVRFLCSQEAKFITGHVLNIDGGLTIQLQEDMGMRQAEFREQQVRLKISALCAQSTNASLSRRCCTYYLVAG